MVGRSEAGCLWVACGVILGFSLPAQLRLTYLPSMVNCEVYAGCLRGVEMVIK